MPRTMAPLIAGGRLSIASVSRNGAAPVSPGEPCNCCRRARQSPIGAPPAFKLACAVRLNRRVRNSDSRPFMTDRTVINAATPSATPTSETQVMKDTKKLCSRASE